MSVHPRPVLYARERLLDHDARLGLFFLGLLRRQRPTTGLRVRLINDHAGSLIARITPIGPQHSLRIWNTVY